MINKVQINNNISFKNNNNKINSNYESYKKGLEDVNDTFKKAGVIGGGVGIASYFIGKNSKNAFNIGMSTYLISALVLSIKNTVKDKKEAQANYQKYENNVASKNGMEKFIESLSTPTYVDLGSEEKNKRYYKMQKEMNIIANKVSFASLGIGAIVGVLTGIFAFAKKIPNKLDKMLVATLISTVASLFVGNIALIPKRTEIYNKQGEQ